MRCTCTSLWHLVAVQSNDERTGGRHKHTLAKTSAHLQTQGGSNTGGIQDLAAHAEVSPAGGDALAAQLRECIQSALAHAHVVGRDPVS